jgi:subtilase family serine protease
VTILASSGDDGAVSTSAAGNPLACGYNPSFPATSPYVTAVGGTMVRCVRWALFAVLLVLCAVRCDLSWHCASERHCPVIEHSVLLNLAMCINWNAVRADACVCDCGAIRLLSCAHSGPCVCCGFCRTAGMSRMLA